MKILTRLTLTALALAGLAAPVFAEAPAGALTPALKTEITDIAKKLRDGGKAAIDKMKPSAAQLEKIAATPEDAKKLSAYTDALYASVKDGLKANPGQTEIFVPEGLPGGYTRTAAKFKSGISIYGFKFVEPGKEIGMAYDGLIKVDGTWVMIPKAWRAFAE